MAKKCLWLLFVVLFLVTGIEGVSRESAIALQNNEYTNILVSISPEVSASSTLVATIKVERVLFFPETNLHWGTLV